MAKPVKPPVDRLIKSGIFSKPRAPQDAPHLYGKLLFFPVWCKKCGLCTVACQTGALKQKKDGTPYLADPDKRKLCSLCWRTCPDFAIVKNPVQEEEKSDSK